MTEPIPAKVEIEPKVEKELIKIEQKSAAESEKNELKEAAKEAKAEKAPAEEKRKEERAAIVYICSSYNNTIVHITDMAGNTLSRVSGGMVTKSDRLKSNPTVAMFVAKKAAERAKDLGITSLYVRVRAQTNAEGMGPGGHAAIKSLGKEGFRILSVLDTTRIPRGGPKKKGGKRGRRV